MSITYHNSSSRFEEIYNYKGYRIQAMIPLNRLESTWSLHLKELDNRLPSKVYGYFYHGKYSLEDYVYHILAEFKNTDFLDRYIEDVGPKPPKPVDRNRISRSRKDRVFKLLQEIKNA